MQVSEDDKLVVLCKRDVWLVRNSVLKLWLDVEGFVCYVNWLVMSFRFD